MHDNRNRTIGLLAETCITSQFDLLLKVPIDSRHTRMSDSQMLEHDISWDSVWDCRAGTSAEAFCNACRQLLLWLKLQLL